MSTCNDCWDEAFRRSQIGGGHQVEHYEAIMLLHPTERPWCAFAQRNGYAAQTRPIPPGGESDDDLPTFPTPVCDHVADAPPHRHIPPGPTAATEGGAP